MPYSQRSPSLENILASAEFGFCLVDGEHHVTYCDPVFARLWDIPQPVPPSEAALLAAMASRLPDDFRDNFQELISPNAAVETLQAIWAISDGRYLHLHSQPVALNAHGEGRLYFSRQATAQERETNQLQYAFQMEEVLARTAAMLINPQSMDAALQEMLAYVGERLGVDRVYVFRLSDDGALLNNTHEWCAPGIEPTIMSMQGLKRQDYAWWMGQLEREEAINASDVSELPDPERELLEEQSVKSVLSLPLHDNGELTGFLGFDETKGHRVWNSLEVRMLEQMTHALESALAKHESGEAQPAAVAERIAGNPWPVSTAAPAPDRIIRMGKEVAERLGIPWEETAEGFMDVPFPEFKHVADELPFPVNVVDNGLFYTYVNPALARLFGFEDPDEIIGNTALFNIAVPDAPDGIMARSSAGNVSDKSVVTKSGEILDLSGMYYTVRCDEGAPQEFVGFDVDRTAEKRRQVMFERLSQFTYDWLLWFDHTGTITYASPSSERIIGYPDTMWVSGLKLEDIVYEEDLDIYASMMRSLLEERTMDRADFRLLRADGRLAWIEMAFIPVYDLEGDFLGSRASLRDVTENHDLQERLLRSERLAVLGELAGSVSHELRNPLNVIKSSSFFIKSRMAEGEEKISSHLERIERSVERADRAIGDLLTFSRLKPPEMQPTDLQKVIEAGVSDMKLPAGVGLEVAAEQAPLVLADPVQLEQLLQNLVLNSVQASQDAGQVRIELSSRNGSAEIAISDDGCGISPADLPRVFEPLFTTKAKGTGFGLAVCRRIVEEHGGHIGIESEQGRGTTVTFTLPLMAGTRRNDES
ncbi:MAG: ATP-binding protein [Candidatus Geothermincolia bacterium]